MIPGVISTCLEVTGFISENIPSEHAAQKLVDERHYSLP